jgi:nitroreductase
MDILEAIRSRRSVGKVAGEVGEEELRTILDAALWAPNHKMTRPWTFTILRGDARARLGAAWATLVAQTAALPESERQAYLDREARKPLRAPAIVVASTRTVADPVVAAEDFAATAAAVQNMLLAAHAIGLGATWRTGPMAYSAGIKQHLGLDPADRILGFVYLGQPAMVPPEPKPRDADGAIRFFS